MFIANFLCVFLIMALSACSSISYSPTKFSGLYRWGNDANNASYLSLRKDKSYLLFSRSDRALENKRVVPYNTIEAKGDWYFENGFVYLNSTLKQVRPGSLRRLKFIRGNPIQLIPELAAGYFPERGYLKDEGRVESELLTGFPLLKDLNLR